MAASCLGRRRACAARCREEARAGVDAPCCIEYDAAAPTRNAAGDADAMCPSRTSAWWISSRRRSACTATRSSANTTASPRTARATSACCRSAAPTPATRIRSACATATTRASRCRIGFGSRVFVCDNLAFIADHGIKRRHTANLKRDLPGLVGELIEPLALHREAQAQHLRALPAHDAHRRAGRPRHHDMYRQGIINVQRIPDVLKEWDEPTFEDFTERNAWRLFNAATYALNGRVWRSRKRRRSCTRSSTACANT